MQIVLMIVCIFIILYMLNKVSVILCTQKAKIPNCKENILLNKFLMYNENIVVEVMCYEIWNFNRSRCERTLET